MRIEGRAVCEARQAMSWRIENHVEALEWGAWRKARRLLAACWLAGGLGGCESGGVGDPCVPEEEYAPDFAAFSAEEAVAETRSMQCETRVCLANHFQGRTSCPYGQTEQQAANDPRCFVPGTQVPIRDAVSPQLLQRRDDDAVYCSCRCDGPDQGARYCECPTGFSCQELVPKLGLGHEELTGSYCIREGTNFVPRLLKPAEMCDAAKKNCE